MWKLPPESRWGGVRWSSVFTRKPSRTGEKNDRLPPLLYGATNVPVRFLPTKERARPVSYQDGAGRKKEFR
jgi:hypothetical protein